MQRDVVHRKLRTGGRGRGRETHAFVTRASTSFRSRRVSAPFSRTIEMSDESEIFSSAIACSTW